LPRQSEAAGGTSPSFHSVDTSLDVDLHEVDGPVLDTNVAKVCQSNDLDLVRRCGQFGGGEAVGDRAFESRILSKLRNLVKRCEAWVIADGAWQIYVPGPSLAQQRVEAKGRLNINPGPSLIIKMSGNRMEVGVSGTNVDIETATPGIENPCNHDIFEILRI
jgi:hypothetical protein